MGILPVLLVEDHHVPGGSLAPSFGSPAIPPEAGPVALRRQLTLGLPLSGRGLPADFKDAYSGIRLRIWFLPSVMASAEKSIRPGAHRDAKAIPGSRDRAAGKTDK